MARFRGTTQGNRTEASRLGHANGGLSATAQGYKSGVRVECGVGASDEDTHRVYMTAGTDGKSMVLLGTVYQTDEGPKWAPARIGG